jgi:hypothetical protein
VSRSLLPGEALRVVVEEIDKNIDTVNSFQQAMTATGIATLSDIGSMFIHVTEYGVKLTKLILDGLEDDQSVLDSTDNNRAVTIRQTNNDDDGDDDKNKEQVIKKARTTTTQIKSMFGGEEVDEDELREVFARAMAMYLKERREKK